MSKLTKMTIWVRDEDVPAIWNMRQTGVIRKFFVHEDPEEEHTDPREYAKELRAKGNGYQEPPKFRVKNVEGLTASQCIVAIMQREPEEPMKATDIGDKIHEEFGFNFATAAPTLSGLKNIQYVIHSAPGFYALSDKGKNHKQGDPIPKLP